MIFLVILLFLSIGGVCSAREKKDVLQFANGDRITCEIIKLEKGYLYVKLECGWNSCNGLVQDHPRREPTEFRSGVGHAAECVRGREPEELQVRVTGSSTSQIVPGTETVGISRTDTNFWQNLHGGLDAGLNYTKQENRTQYSFQGNALFQRTKWSAAVNYQSGFSGGGNLSNFATMCN